MEKELYRRALEYHGGTRPGKIAVVPTKPHATQHDLALAYSPGVAARVSKSHATPHRATTTPAAATWWPSSPTARPYWAWATSGPKRPNPVMEGKCMLFKLMAAGIDAFDLELDARDPEAFVETVCRLAPTFGAVNLRRHQGPGVFRKSSGA